MNHLYLAKFGVFFAALLAAIFVPGSSKLQAADQPVCVVDNLVGEWDIDAAVGANGSVPKIKVGDYFDIEKVTINGQHKYLLVMHKMMTKPGRHWAPNKKKNIGNPNQNKFPLKLEKVNGCDILCADGIDGVGVGPLKKHIIQFWPVLKAGGWNVTYFHKVSGNSCSGGNVHRGVAHGQN